ncbi:MAG: 3-oxoacid CoA-transferase [Planctomycetaceae bacterium]|nr:3-oxoacid CoA-transferase [Planctomycetaceae bacterium]
MTVAAPYTPMELMICAAASTLEDGAMVVVGTGAPCAAAMLAQKTTAPNLTLMFEAGGVGPLLPRMPISVGDSRTFYEGLMATSMSDIMETCQRGMVDYTFLGGGQIDAYGNLNSTMIGKDYQRPDVRFPGSGGASDLGSLCWRVMVLTPHDRRRFVKKLDFMTTPGYIDGPGAREDAGLPAGSGPHKVITNLAVMGFDEETKRMRVESLHPDVDLEDVEANTEFELLQNADMAITAEPPPEQLEILRREVDPHRYIIGR